MSNSGRLINYGVRPAKHIERKMMRDIFLRLYAFYPLSSYQYIGFGAKYFIDFHLFHKTLHIDKMVSIEGDVNNRQRYNFNKPFDCIEILFGNSNDVLPRVDFTDPSIVWLDYDSRFHIGMLDDISTLISELCTGSVFSLSYNSQPYTRQELQEEDGKLPSDAYRQKFIEIVGEDNIPQGFDERGWSRQTAFSKFLYDAVLARINRCVSERNAREEDEYTVKQVLYFDYADGQRMETLSFILLKVSDLAKYESCNFTNVSFFRGGHESFTISTPNFTFKEIRHLMEKMPNIDVTTLNSKVFNEGDVQKFSELYKYFPTYNEVEVL